MANKLINVLIGTFNGINGEGSAKRATAFYFTAILLTSLTAVFEYSFYISSISLKPTEVQIMIVKMYEPIHFSLQITIWMLLGLATLETITSLVKAVKGDKE